MTESNSREPGAWELLRGIQGINGRLDEFAKGYVRTDVFALHVEKTRELERELDVEKDDREKAVSELRQSAEERRKSTAQVWVAIGLAAVSVAFSLFGSIIRQGLGLP